MSNTQLPAHLLALFNAHPEATSIGSSIESESFAKIRYNGSKFKLIKATGEEVAVTTTAINADGQPAPCLDVIVVGINEHKSHTVYTKAFDPKGDPEAPVWSSDDGTPVPAEHETKVVSDYRRWAVLIADNPDGGVFELRVSAGSITNGDRYVTALKNFGVPIAAMVTRITFDTSFDYPKLVFTPAAYLHEAQSGSLKKVLESGQASIAIAIGKKKEAAMLGAPLAAAQITYQPTAEATPVVAERKTRQRKAEAAPVVATAPAPAQVFTMPPVAQQTAAAAIVTNPSPTDAGLDALLTNIMGGKK